MATGDTEVTEERYGWVMVGVAAVVVGTGFGTLCRDRKSVV